MVISGRTDLAGEAHRLWRRQADQTTALPGIKAREELIRGFPLTSVEILDEEIRKKIREELKEMREKYYGR